MDELIFENQEKASSYLFDLSNILQYILYECNDDKIPLEREIDFIKKYIKLYSINLENGFIDLKVIGPINNLMVPPMLFIPLIENTMKHSNKNITNPGIEISVNQSNIILKTQNHIKPISKNKSLKSGMGLENLTKRLQLIYGDKQQLIIKEEESIFQVELSIPI